MSTLLSSCSLLVSSPIHYSRPSNHGRHPHRNHKVYNGSYEVPAEGCTFEFDCANDDFYILRIFDSSLPVTQGLSNSRFFPSYNDCISVNDLTYAGPFYTITCNQDEQNWNITVDPITTTPGMLDNREVWVFMRDRSDDSYFVIKFEQNDPDSYGYIR